ncbi:flavin-containing monooxygenase [Mesorhizobium neociceri]|uniref:Trimethylamine monooxygenase n=1 Tax=Mesorhizobium neociceri TaxID=1307853 RepID=A0A838BDI0_9HYPH|nr:NAD(P)/FAD-dependent oxidoreductase [Mesorhizobium neociceri]MBA1143420.1 NAD(P)/FAD-dependent oxidoreductase [Mesorhizobium neociceri]
MDTTVVIVGAGPAGLAVGACLKRAGVNFVILEKAREVAPAWRRHYRRLHLHTVKSFSSLPFQPFPRDYPRYVPRELVVRYLDDYAQKFDLRPRFGVTVRSIRRDDSGFLVEAESDSLTARHVVIASGNNAEPIVPKLAAIEDFRGEVLHSADYTQAAPFVGRSVLIVGMGNTGAEIALDLAESGAKPTISVRKGVHIVPRQLFGVPIQMVGIASRPMPQALNDWMFPIILDFALGKLDKYGIVRPRQGILQQIDEVGRIPVIDVGTVDAITKGAIKIAPDIARFAEHGAEFTDGRRENFDAVILATGYRPGYEKFVPAELQPERSGVNARASQLGLYLVGFYNPVTGLLREIGREAIAVAADIARRG